jgi:S1-C subfamily serine protease
MTRTALVAVVLAMGASARAQDLKALAQALKTSVVVLETDEAFGEPTGIGTGFFISPEGRIATNHHVIEGAQAIVARTHDRRRIRVEAVVATDEENDLAILRAEPGAYVPLALGESSSVESGERVVVLGNPLGLDFTLSEGIVSAVRAANELKEDGLDLPHVQISAPISFGSSGSPVLNLSGEVIGVVASGYMSSQNLNFAVPVDFLRALSEVADRNPEGSRLPTRWVLAARNLGISAAFFLAILWGVRRFQRRR